jgi:PAS domain S-box-containing protein
MKTSGKSTPPTRTRVKAERKRSDEDVRYRALFEQSPFGVLVIDTEGKVLDFNAAAHQQLGYSRKEFARLRISDLDPVQSPEEIRKSIEDITKKGKAEFEVKHRAKNGEIRDVQVITQALVLSGQTVFHTIWRDITEQKRAQEAIKQSEAKFGALFDSASDAIFILDFEGNLVDINQTAYSRLGYTKDEMLSMHVSRLHSPAFAGLVPEKIALVREQGHGVVHSEHVRRDGTVMPVEINAKVIDYDGKKAIFSIIRDITERKRAEEARVQGEKRFHALFNNTPLGVVAVGTDQRILDCNNAFQKMLGYAREELLAMSIPDISHPGDDLATRSYYRDMVEGKVDSFTAEKRQIRKDGTDFWTNLTGTLIRDEKNNPQILFGIVEDISERKKAEESLQLFTNLVNRSNDAIFVNDPATGRFLLVNDKACSNLGFERSRLLTLRTLDIETTFPDQAAWDAHVRDVRNRGSLLLEGVHKRQDGTLFPVEVNVTYMTLGNRDYMVALSRDITERKLAEQALRTSEERLAKAQKMAHVGNWAWNIVTNMLYWSEEVYHIYGVDPVTFVPTFENVGKAMHPADLPLFLQAVHAAIYEQKPFEMDYRLFRPDGSERTVHTIGAVSYDTSGKPLIKSGTVQDITERKKLEEALRSSKEFIERILNTVDEAFIVIDRDYRIMMANNAYASQAGMPLQDILGKRCHEISHQSNMPCFESGDECSIRQCFETGEPQSCVHRHTSKDGSILYVEIKAFPLKDAAGTVTSAIEVINNMTDKHLLEEQILRTQKLEAVGLLAGGLAHDFNNLLQGVFGNISMAKMFSDRAGKAYAMLEGAETALYQATNLTKQLLTFSKGGEPVKKVIDMPSLVDNAVKFSLSGSNVNYRSFVDDLLWPVEADDGQINQVIHNIVLNACEAMPDGGTVGIEMRNVTIDEKSGLPLKQGKYVKLDIRDSGTGIPASHLPKIFDPYFTTRRKGSGLGLATSYSIVTKHGGMITASSQLGVGSVFTMYLPASDQNVLPVEVQTGGLLTGNGRILIMDDEEIVRLVAGNMIQSLGYDVDFAENGEQAIEKYGAAMRENRPYHAVILDLTIRGGMGGKEAVGKLATIDPEVRAIVSSGYSADDIVSHYRDYGFQEVLSKPYQIDVLGRVLYHLLHREG